MDYTIIEVPDKNDSVSKVVLLGTQYQIRFTWNDTGQFWSLGLLTSLGEPLLLGLRIVPNYPLNLFYCTENLPQGFFAALTRQETISRSDFTDGTAQFVFVPAEQ